MVEVNSNPSVWARLVSGYDRRNWLPVLCSDVHRCAARSTVSRDYVDPQCSVSPLRGHAPVALMFGRGKIDEEDAFLNLLHKWQTFLFVFV